MEKYPIDIVIPWVDGNDPLWQKEYQKYSTNANSEQYRDWGLLRFWFRGIEQFMPWVNKIYFVTSGHVPEWLNLNHPQIVHIHHDDYIPMEYLPTFNSSAIEFFFNRIPGLSEHFLLFNDDVFLTSKVSCERFFRNGLPCDMPLEGVYKALPIGHSRTFYNNISYINQHFKKREVIKKNASKWFHPKFKTGLFRNLAFSFIPYFITFKPFHLAQPFLKSTYDEVYSIYGQELEANTMTRFRSELNVTQYLQRIWQLCNGRFFPYDPRKKAKYVQMDDSNIDYCVSLILNQRHCILCLNDGDSITDFETSRSKLQQAFLQILPNKSDFEK